MAERLQKWLAGIGLGSRREIEGWIRDGRVSVNGTPAVLGQKVTGREAITVDGRPVHGSPDNGTPQVLLYHKPAGEICTRSDPEGRPSIFAALPKPRAGRWVSVGRLDFQTSGLMILTTDGELAHRLMHPSTQLEREYAVRVQGDVDARVLQRLRAGIRLDDGAAAFTHIERGEGRGSNSWFRVVVREGRNRLVRRLWGAVGCNVSRLIRVRFGPMRLPRDLPRGRSREVASRDVAALYRAAGLPDPGVKQGNRP